MHEQEPITATASTGAQPAAGRGWKQLAERFSYQRIVHNMPYLIFVTFLCILYIANNNRAVSLTRSLNEKHKILKELKWRYLDVQSRLMYQTSESQLKIKTEAIGLRPLEKPAFEIKVTVPKQK